MISEMAENIFSVVYYAFFIKTMTYTIILIIVLTAYYIFVSNFVSYTMLT